jgi:hypothetical protein
LLLSFPPFVGAQIKNCTAQGKVTQKLKLKKKKTTTQEKYAFMATIHTIKICLYGKDDNILVFKSLSMGNVTTRA